MNAECLEQLLREKARATELCLVACIEAAEDRVPTDAEVVCFGWRDLSARREDYYWRGRLIVRVDYWPTPEMPYQILSLVNPAWPVPI